MVILDTIGLFLPSPCVLCKRRSIPIAEGLVEVTELDMAPAAAAAVPAAEEVAELEMAPAAVVAETAVEEFAEIVPYSKAR